eukprot:gene31588-39019_t
MSLLVDWLVLVHCVSFIHLTTLELDLRQMLAVVTEPSLA